MIVVRKLEWYRDGGTDRHLRDVRGIPEYGGASAGSSGSGGGGGALEGSGHGGTGATEEASEGEAGGVRSAARAPCVPSDRASTRAPAREAPRRTSTSSSSPSRIATAPKSSRIYEAYGRALQAAREHPAEGVPLHIRDAPPLADP